MRVELKNCWVAVAPPDRTLKAFGNQGRVSHGTILECGDEVDKVDVGDTVIYEDDMVINIEGSERSLMLIPQHAIIAVVSF